jgi:sugar lactone lactonase YvrE
MITKSEKQQAEIVREYGPFEGVDMVHGVTFDGKNVWFAHDGGLVAFDAERGSEQRRIATDADAGTAFDGSDLWQITGAEIRRIDRETGKVLASIPAPSAGCSGLAFADGVLWVGEYRDRKIHKVDARTGRVLKTIESDSFVTGVTFADGELWHGTMGDAPSEIRRVDAETGAVLERLEMPEGVKVSGLEAAGDVFYAGAHQQKSATVRAVKRPRRAGANRS